MQRILWKPCAMLVGLILAVSLAGCGQGGGETTTTAGAPSTTASTAPSTTAATTASTAPPPTAGTTTTAPTTTTILSGLPTLSDVEGFRKWLKMNLQPIAGRTHGSTNIYINQPRATIAPAGQLTFPFPDGTVIVKEVIEGGLVAIMRKVNGVDPAHGDWQYVEYRADGGIVGKDESCWTCHTGARSTDWVFTELETP